MESIAVIGGNVLNGSVTTSGSKNAALPILFSSSLADGVDTFHNVPNPMDIDSTELLLRHLNCDFHREGNVLQITTAQPEEFVAPYDIVRKMRGGTA